MKYRIEKGYDHYNGKPLFRVVGRDNDFSGEWTRNDAEAGAELFALLHHDGNLAEASDKWQALTAYASGLHVFTVHPMAEDEPALVTDPAILENYAYDSIILETGKKRFLVVSPGLFGIHTPGKTDLEVLRGKPGTVALSSYPLPRDPDAIREAGSGDFKTFRISPDGYKTDETIFFPEFN